VAYTPQYKGAGSEDDNKNTMGRNRDAERERKKRSM
jgi:hypothetical protein